MTRAAFRRAVAVAAVALSAAVAHAQDDPVTVRREIEFAARAGAHDRAAAFLDRLLDPQSPRDRARDVEAAKSAIEFLPWDVAAPRAGRLLTENLRRDRTDRDGAWSAAQDLRKRMLRRVDVANGVPFLEELIRIYPESPEYSRDLSRLLLDGGRRDEARVHLERRFRMAPSDTEAAYTLALLADEDGDLDGAVRYYDRLIEARPQELAAHLYKVRVLWMKDRDEARRALDQAMRAAEASPSESVRADFLERFRDERRRMDDADRRRELIRAIDRRISLTTWAALLAWAVVAALGLHATRRAPAPGGAPGA